MIYHVALYSTVYWSFFNVFHYVSVRAIASLLTTLCTSLLLGRWFIRKSQQFFRAKSREFAPNTHKAKDDMPTMGGMFILMAVVMNTFFWADLSKACVWVFLINLVFFGAIGAWDDWCKIQRKKGISARTKFLLQSFASFVVVTLWLFICQGTTTVTLPFFKGLQPDIGYFFVAWAAFILVGCSNAVNLTDGLDGLAIGSLMPNFIIFSLVNYLSGHVHFAHYLHIPFTGTAEIAVLGSILIGASLGFLWYNAYPAQIFMGDVGSLALGSGLALMALMAKHELLLLISGGLFVVETVSVIAQVISYKLFKKRIFRMAPIHHHFELLGWPEAKITVRFGIISLVLCLLAVITLKLR